MGNPVVRFEIGCRDRDASRRFYEETFGWTIADGMGGEIDPGVADALPGALVALGHEPHNYVLVYFEVDDIAAHCATVAENGGAVEIGPVEIPGDKGRFAWIKDPEGNRLALYESPRS